jgi:hypothetical protein
MSFSSGDREILNGLTHPMPPADLRARTLAAARLATTADPSLSPWQAILVFLGAQRGWAAAVVVLLLAHLLFGFLQEETLSPRAVLPRSAEEAAQPDLLRLPRIKDLAYRGPAVTPERIHVEGDLS